MTATSANATPTGQAPPLRSAFSLTVGEGLVAFVAGAAALFALQQAVKAILRAIPMEEDGPNAGYEGNYEDDHLLSDDERSAVYESLARSFADADAGRVIPARAVFDELLDRANSDEEDGLGRNP